MKTSAPLSKNQYGVYVECMQHTGEVYYNLPFLYVLDSSLDEKKLKNALDHIRINIAYEKDVQHVFLNLQDVSAEIRSEKVGNMASKTAALPLVREKLLDLQRDIAAKNDVLMDGRDTLRMECCNDLVGQQRIG